MSEQKKLSKVFQAQTLEVEKVKAFQFLFLFHFVLFLFSTVLLLQCTCQNFAQGKKVGVDNFFSISNLFFSPSSLLFDKTLSVGK
jgi:hypothetical protein